MVQEGKIGHQVTVKIGSEKENDFVLSTSILFYYYYYFIPGHLGLTGEKKKERCGGRGTENVIYNKVTYY